MTLLIRRQISRGRKGKPKTRRKRAVDVSTVLLAELRELKKTRKAYFPQAGGFVDTPVYDRGNLKNGDRIGGPAIVEEPDSTTICPPRFARK